jgi:hypothetical protein
MTLSAENRELLIRDSIRKAQKQNITLQASNWGIEWSKPKERWVPKKDQGCCALGCVILENQDKLSKHNWRQWTVETILETNSEWVRNFQLGFDGFKKSEYDDGTFAYELGALLRDELINKDVQIKMPNM